MPKAAAEPAASPAAPTLEPEAADSPRAAARAFLELSTRQGNDAGAARYLVLSAGEERGPELARRLGAVLERHLDVDLDAVSPASAGNLQDGLPDGVDTLGHVPDGHGGQDSVFMVRVPGPAGPHWAFSRQTVSRVDAWYDALPDRFIRDVIPQPLQRYGRWELMWWQWLALPVLGALALVPDAASEASRRACSIACCGARRPSGTIGCSPGLRRRSRCCGPSWRPRRFCPGWCSGPAHTPSCAPCSVASRTSARSGWRGGQSTSGPSS